MTPTVLRNQPPTPDQDPDEDVLPVCEQAVCQVASVSQEVRNLIHHSWQFCDPPPSERVTRLTQLRRTYGEQLNGAFPDQKNLYFGGRVVKLRWNKDDKAYMLT